MALRRTLGDDYGPTMEQLTGDPGTADYTGPTYGPTMAQLTGGIQTYGPYGASQPIEYPSVKAASAAAAAGVPSVSVMAPATTPATQQQLIPGVSNSLLIGGAAVLALLAIVAGQRKGR